jgi:uncharacterized cupredoxin-like copper-binding protein
MIMRLFLLFGLVLLGGTAYFIVIETPPTVQVPPAVGEYARLREEGIIPEGILSENEEVEHDVFGVPPEDEEMIAAATENMDMGGMDMGDGATMNMDMGDDAQMDMAEGTTMDMDMDGDGTMDMAEADMPADGAMDMGDDGQMEMSEADEEEADRLMAGQMAGLIITDDGEFDREITLSMSEWTFSDLEIDAQAGERIQFTVRNDGEILHEFMFMGMAQMQGVEYRARRADWNLLEHEALFEQSLLLPGDEITFVAEVVRPGVWMFMCMLPYHMQMGMMGQVATEGMAMDM